MIFAAASLTDAMNQFPDNNSQQSWYVSDDGVGGAPGLWSNRWHSRGILTIPVGIYVKQSLTGLCWWDKLKNRLG
ncbi:hypothetical protein ACFQ1T_02410 [Methylophilus glucosoxydans]|uniref:Uncharacterized protein n=1 Tax=Methylophilus glucosoxydans TaxID=752553 RepID=A0ABW3GEG9_9PROT